MKNLKSGKDLLILGLITLLLLSLAESAFCVDDAGTLEKGQVSLEAEREEFHYRNGDVSTYYTYYFYYGFSNNFQFRIARPWVQSTVGGVSAWDRADTGIEFKYRFQEETEKRPAIALEVNADLDDGSDIPTHYLLADYGFTFAASKNFAKNLQGRLNLGCQFETGVPPRNNFVSYGAALVKAFGKSFSMQAEVFGTGYQRTPGQLEADVAAYFNLPANFVFSVTYTWGLNDIAPRNHLDLDLSVTF